MYSSFCVCAHYCLPYAAVGVASIVIIFAASFTYIFSSLLLTTVVVLTFTKLKPALGRNEVSPSVLESHINISLIPPEEQLEEETDDGEAYSGMDSLSLSETESVDLSTTSEESDGQYHHCPFPFQKKANGALSSSEDGSISDEDEDSLIEIALYEGHYICPRDESCFKSYSKLPSFRQESLMELLAEINEMYEEDNMIEIDLSMGSIMCSRIGIQA